MNFFTGELDSLISEIVRLETFVLPKKREEELEAKKNYEEATIRDVEVVGGYKDKSFYTMSTDSLDRFGTRLEQRFTKLEIKEMMIKSGLDNISFSPNAPFHCAIGYKK